jgi:hypothetical protein
VTAVAANSQCDGLGRRITRTVSGTSQKYLQDGLDVVQAVNGSDDWLDSAFVPVFDTR